MSEKIIFHIDVNSAFLSWEAVHRLEQQRIQKSGAAVSKDESDPAKEEPDLRTIPSAVGGDIAKRHGVILAKSIPAKQYNIRTGESIMEARRKCPNLVIVPPSREIYQKYSKAFMDILREYTPDVEPFSIDEAFMDMTGTKLLFGEPVYVAGQIKDRIKNELGFTVNIGISSNKILAKMASDFKKPDLVHTLFPDEIRTKMWGLPVSDLFFVGRAATKKLLSMGIRTIGDLAQADVELIKLHLKKQGEVIWNFANGVDFSVVHSEPVQNKGYGNSTTVGFDVTDADTARLILLTLAEKIAVRLRKDGVKVEAVSVGIKDYNFKSASHQKILDAPTNITAEIHRAACELFDELWDGTPLRLLGIQTTKIRENEAGRQLNFFDNTNYEKLEKLDAAVDKIRGKFGNGVVKRAVFLDNKDKKQN